jgi:hypothetical protein
MSRCETEEKQTLKKGDQTMKRKMTTKRKKIIVTDGRGPLVDAIFNRLPHRPGNTIIDIKNGIQEALAFLEDIPDDTRRFVNKSLFRGMIRVSQKGGLRDANSTTWPGCTPRSSFLLALQVFALWQGMASQDRQLQKI